MTLTGLTDEGQLEVTVYRAHLPVDEGSTASDDVQMLHPHHV